MDLNYNRKEHLELLKKGIVSLESEDSKKLMRYKTMMNTYLDWCIREYYLELLENFQEGEIEACNFCITFENTGKLTSDILDILESNLIILSPNKKALGFVDLLEEIFDACYAYLEDVRDYEFYIKNDMQKYDMEFKNSIEEIYLKIQSFLNEG